MAAPPSTAKLRFKPTLLDRLIDREPAGSRGSASLKQWKLEELKDAVARDVEVLLNSRSAMRENDWVGYPETERSVAAFGMIDFVGLSLANPADRSHICQSLERTIADHEPRLRNVKVGLELGRESVNRLRFSIAATLHVPPIREPVSFDALLQPTTLRYSVAAGPGR